MSFVPATLPSTICFYFGEGWLRNTWWTFKRRCFFTFFLPCSTILSRNFVVKRESVKLLAWRIMSIVRKNLCHTDIFGDSAVNNHNIFLISD